MPAEALRYLRCPVCAGALADAGPAVRCPAGHSYDRARAGYLPLTTRPITVPGDTAAMVAARTSFLATGGYEFLAAALAASAGRSGLVVDVGAGTGYYLARVLAQRPDTVGLALDVSRPALRRAARAHPRAAAVRADAWQRLPVADRAAATVLSIFAPRPGAELARVLAGDGVLLVVTPTPGHLAELRRLPAVDGVRLLRVDPAKPERLAAALTPWLRRRDEDVLTHRLALSRSAVRSLVAMGPSAVHTDPAALDRAVALLPEPFPVTASVRLTRFQPI